MAGRPGMAMSSDFLEAYARLPRAQQKGVRSLIVRFNTDPTASGLNYERIHTARDPAMRSLRIDRNYRAIVLKPERGDVHMLLWADKHDRAYAWAARHECRINPETGALQVYAPRTDRNRILFTTFTRNLAADIEHNLRAICTPEEMERIEVTNLDRWVVRFLRRRRYQFRIVYDRGGDAGEAWQRALT